LEFVDMRSWSNTHREDVPLLRGKEMPESLDATEGVPGLRSVPFHAAREFWLSALSGQPALKPIRPMESFTPPALEPEPEPEPVAVAPEPFVAAKPATAVEVENSFREEGEYWQIAYDGSRIGVRNRKGLFYLHYLLLHPDEKIHVSNLAALGDRRFPPPCVDKLDGVTSGLEVTTRLADAGEVLDARATQEYRERLIDLRGELDEATRWADLERADSIRREIGFLTAQLTAAYGRGGRARKLSDPSERVRKAVTKCIREAIDHIAKQHPSLGRHLRNAIQTGFYCSYSPESAVSWRA